jgi:RHS repeat-associated protein
LALGLISQSAGWQCGLGVAVDPQGTLLIADLLNHRIRTVGLAYPGFSGHDLVIPSEDGGDLYVFDPVGRHLRTLHALTGTVRYAFGYDSQGRLATITDGNGNVTSIERDGAGEPMAILAADGQRTAITLDAHGYLASLTNPVGETHRFAYSTEGLLQTYTTPRNHQYGFTYDALGRLTRHEDPAAGFRTFARTESDTSHAVTLTTALNRTSTFWVDHLLEGGIRLVDNEADGTATTRQRRPNATQTTTAPDGTVTTLTETPDPRFALLAPLPGALTVRLPSGLTSSLGMTRAVTLSDPNNVLSLTSLTDTFTVNGRTATSTYTASTKTRTDRSPANRVVTTILDTQGRTVREQVDSLEPIAFTYDPRGRLSTVTQGTGGTARTSTFTYNPEGFLETINDPLSRTVRFTYDPVGRVLTQTLPDLRVIQTTYDANGNVASITPPSRPAHTFGYTPVDLESSYTPPDLGSGPVATTYTYNPDQQLTQVTRPDGQTLALDYAATTGRLTALTAPTGQTVFSYHPTTGNVSNITSPGGVGLSYTYDGSLLTGATWTGPVAGSVTRTYDTDFRIATESLTGENPITFQYDPDSLLTQAGSLTLTRHPQHGLLTGTTLGNVTDSLTYTTFGELATYQASVSGSPLLSTASTRDALGRITQTVETIGGVTTTTGYAYDQAGRVVNVTQDGTLAAHYEYDPNGNRLSVTRPVSGTVAGTYDVQDRLTSYGAVTYTYTANGDLLTATSGSETTAYSYDVFGNLVSVGLPNGNQIEYLIDGQHRRIGKRVNGVLTQGFLYSTQLRPAAELDGSGGVVARFVYGTRINVPDYMIRGSTTYRLLTDALGSVRLVIDTATGAIAQRMDYDEFGQITLDTTPGFQPFGFAGGLYDPDTKLTRFGARDYDAFTGRWTTKDPIGFGGGDRNLYGYAKNSPANFTDPLGLATYRCRRPLQPLPGVGQKSGPESSRNPLYHEFICVKIGGRTICGGQAMAPGKYTGNVIPWGPGAPSDDYYDPRHCEETSQNGCMDACLLSAFGRSRPAYGLIGPGTNCQEWAGEVYGDCAKKCGEWH